MKTLNQETQFDNLKDFVLTDIEMNRVRGGDGEGDPGNKGTVTPPITEPEI
jgi:hypothetical protein